MERIAVNSNAIAVLHVVPLISLMKDQDPNLDFCGISMSCVGNCSEQKLLEILVAVTKSTFSTSIT